jgi:hypothetical protein
MRCAGINGMKQGMEESYGKGVANHSAPGNNAGTDGNDLKKIYLL